MNDFKDPFSGSDTKDSSGNREIRNPEIMRALIPGQVSWDNARTSWANNRKRDAGIYVSVMLGETIVTGATSGMGGAATQTTKLPTKKAGAAILAYRTTKSFSAESLIRADGSLRTSQKVADQLAKDRKYISI